MTELTQIMEMLKNQNEMRLKDKEDDKKEKELVKEENKTARDEMAKQMREGIREEIKEVMKPWQNKTEEVEKKTEALADEVSTLVKELAGLKQQLANKSTFAEVAGAGGGAKPRAEAGAGAHSTLTGANAAPLGRKTLQMEPDIVVHEKAKKEAVIKKSRRTLGFGPIKEEDVARQHKECSLFGEAANETQAKEMAVMELMLLDMKISKEEQKDMEIVRVFAPKRENAQMLYCEFKNMSSVYKVYSHSRHMTRGTTISPYIPKEHYSRYRAMEEICYNWRKEEGARTKVKMGEMGLELWKKEPGHLEYIKVPLDSLGELPEVAMYDKEETREDRQLTSSPPAGRPGYTPPSGR